LEVFPAIRRFNKNGLYKGGGWRNSIRRKGRKWTSIYRTIKGRKKQHRLLGITIDHSSESKKLKSSFEEGKF